MPGLVGDVRRPTPAPCSSRSRSTCSGSRARSLCSARCPTASAAGRCCSRASRSPRSPASRRLRRLDRRPDRRAHVQALGASTGHRDRPRHHPRPLRARPRRLDDRLGHHGDGSRADDRAADRRHARHAFGWQAIFVSVAAWLRGVRLGRAGAAGDPQVSSAGGARHLRADMRALCSSPRFLGYALCAGFSSAMFFTFLGGAPHVVVDMLGKRRPNTACGSSCPRSASWRAISWSARCPAATASTS